METLLEVTTWKAVIILLFIFCIYEAIQLSALLKKSNKEKTRLKNIVKLMDDIDKELLRTEKSSEE